MRYLGKIIIVLLKGILGMGAIYLSNIALKSFEISVGLNVVNGLVIGILGVCGYFLLYILAILDATLY